jgi:hypothetical protein
LEFKLQDCWVGVYWEVTKRPHSKSMVVDLWVCLLPTLPMHFQWEQGTDKVKKE